MRLGGSNCEPELCAHGSIDFSIEKSFTRYDPQWPWVDNVGLILLSTDVEFSGEFTM